jgi:hypothetical protein
VHMIKPLITDTFKKHDQTELRKALHRIRGAITYLILPELDVALETFHQTVKEDFDTLDKRVVLEKQYHAVMDAMDAFLKAMA